MILYGARGQAKVIYDLILSNNRLLEYLLDDTPPTSFPHQLPIYIPTNDLLANKEVIIAIGDNLIRECIAKRIAAQKVAKMSYLRAFYNIQIAYQRFVNNLFS